MKTELKIFLLIVLPALVYSEDVKREHFGTLFETEITADHVSVRALPGLNTEVLFQLNRGDMVCVTGISEKAETIENKAGYWLLIECTPKLDSKVIEMGWLFSAFVKGCQNIVPSKIKVDKYTPATSRRGATLDIIVDRNGTVCTYKTQTWRLANQPFITFTWSKDDNDFKYTDIPGTYVWYPDTNQIRHVCYLGTSVESAWVCFTDDFKYALEDFGTSPVPRGIEVWAVDGEKKLYSGTYYPSIEMKGHEITIIYEYTDLSIKYGIIDKETAEYAKDYLRKHPMTSYREDGLTNTLIVKYRLNLDSKERKFVRCEYIITQ